MGKIRLWKTADISIDKILMYLGFASSVLYLFFWEYKFVVYSWVAIVLIGSLSFLSLLWKRRVCFPKPLLFLLSFVFINIMEIPLSSAELSEIIRWCLSVLIVFIFSLSISQQYFNSTRAITTLSFVLLFHVVGVYLNIFAPSIVRTINSYTLKEGSYYNYLLLNSYGYYSGFSGFTNVSGFFCGVASIVFLSYSISLKRLKRLFFFLLCLVSFTAAVFTQKRSIVIAVPVAIFIILLIRTASDKRAKTNLMFILILIVLGYAIFYILTNTESGKLMLARFSNSGDISSGRFGIYELLLSDWRRLLVIGNGPASIQANFGFEAHNIYLQILYENGLICLILMLAYFTSNLLFAFSAYRYYFNEEGRFNEIIASSIGVQILFLVYGLFGNCLSDTFLFFIYSIFSAVPFGDLIIKDHLNGMKKMTIMV